MEMATLWKIISKPTELPPQTPLSRGSALWKTISKSPIRSHERDRSDNNSSPHNNKPPNHRKVKICTSLEAATSFTRVCLCAPISYADVFRAELPARRSSSCPRSRAIPSPEGAAAKGERQSLGSARRSGEGVRRVFRGKSVTEDVLMRRVVVEEEAKMQVRRRNQMEVIRRRSAFRRRKLGPSPLCRMTMAAGEDDL